MPGISPDGWPYILDDDHPMEYPAYSQSLATLMDSRWDTYQTEGLVGISGGWADFGSGAGTSIVTRSGGMVTVEFAVKRTTDYSWSGSTPFAFGWVPAGFLPVHDVNFSGVMQTTVGYTACRLRVMPSNAIQVVPFTATGTVGTGMIVCGAVTYRGA